MDTADAIISPSPSPKRKHKEEEEKDEASTATNPTAVVVTAQQQHFHQQHKLVMNSQIQTSTNWFGKDTTSPSIDYLLSIATRMEYSSVQHADQCCGICLENFQDPEKECLRLHACTGEHFFHRECLRLTLELKLKCPMCSKKYGISKGPQPEGTMTIYLRCFVLPGEETTSKGTFILRYVFPDGTQDSRHPNPGVPFKGTTRQAYIPCTPHGVIVLRKFMRAWDARLLFAVNTSITTGVSNTVVWNGIHHKTNVLGGPLHFGFPDPHYLHSVERELDQLGVE